MSAEVTARMAADDILQASIDAEVTNRMNAVAIEQSARIAADSSLSDALSQEVSNRQAADDVEQSARIAADSSLSSALSQEISDRQAAVSAEESARIAAVSAEESARIAEDLTFVKLDGTRSMTADLSVGGHKVTLVQSPDAATDAATKGYVDSKIAGLMWQDPILDPDLVRDDVNDPSGVTVENYAIYIAGNSAGGVWAGKSRHAMYYDGSMWHDLLGRPVQVNDRFGICMEYAGPAAGGLLGKEGNIVEITDITGGVITYDFHAPLDKEAVFVPQSTSSHFGHSYTYVVDHWVEFSGPSAIEAGVALAYDVNVLNVQHGAGITVNGSNQLELVLDGSIAFTGDISAASHKLMDLSAPENDGDATNKLYVDNSMSAEQSARLAADADLSAAIAAETSSRISAFNAAEAYTSDVETSLNNEVSRAQAAEAGLQASINAEQTARMAADAILQSNIDAEVTNRMNAVSVEQSAREAAINAEVTARMAADSSLSDALVAETSARIAGDAAEQSARMAADSSLSDALTQEVSDRQAAVSAEQSARVAADTSLSNAIAQEVSDRQAADANLQAQITNNISTAIAQEVSDRQAAIAAEESARMAADTSLSNAIAAEALSRFTADSAEASARMAADSSLSNAIAQEVSDRQAAITDLQSYVDARVAFTSESFTLSATDITNGYITLANAPRVGTVQGYIDRLVMFDGEDYSVSGAKVTFMGDVAAGGAEALVAGDIVKFRYQV